MHELNLNKLKLQTPNKTDENIEKLAQLFPNIISEKKDKSGVKKAIDFDLLRQILSDNIVEGDEERYRLDWPGKKASLLKANTPVKKTLRPSIEESKNFENTQNLYIEGDNFEVLKLLQESYLNKIKMIYIDPPYNTGKDFVYRDNFRENNRKFEDKKLGIRNEEEHKLFKNTDANGHFHSDWLSMMYERLLISRDLLKDDGVIFISINDNEVHNLKKICDEIFGENNFIGEFIWKNKSGGANDSKYIAIDNEYIVSYSKNINLLKINLDKNATVTTSYNLKDEKGRYSLDRLDKQSLGYLKSLDFPILGPDGIEYRVEHKNSEVKVARWRWGRNTVDERYDELVFKNGYVYTKNYEKDGAIPRNLLIEERFGRTRTGKTDFTNLFSVAYFSAPKPINLIKYFIEIVTQKDDLILDFFSGSSTTAHAVMDLNAQDEGNRKFIMVQLQEATDEKSEAYKAGYKTIPEIGKERIRRAGEKILEDNKDKENIKNLDIGFRVLKTDSSNFKDVYYHPSDLGQQDLFNFESNIKEDRDELDLLFQIMLDLGVELSLKITKESIDNTILYILENSELIACFSENISLEVIEKIKAHNPYKVVLKDGCFANDTDKINAIQSLSLSTSVSVI